MSPSYTLALHGGVPAFAPGNSAEEAPYRDALLEAVAVGQSILADGGSALQSVIATVVQLEDCPLFNAGRGSAYTAEASHELDAGVMDGSSLAAGAVASVRRVRNPVLAALEVMRQGRCVLLGAEGAERLARERGLEIVEPSYFSTPQRLAQLRAAQARDRNLAVDDEAPVAAQEKLQPSGTVGAVARDRNGHLAAATSTGGLTNKLPSRIADTPIVGAGVYANDGTCAVSCTGTGEHFIRGCVAHDVHARIHYLHQDVVRAARDSIDETLAALDGGRGGVIAVGRDGQVAMPFNSVGMFRAWVREGETPLAAIFAV
jgi:beta-aspartyl-peptidase (threonine type)